MNEIDKSGLSEEEIFKWINKQPIMWKFKFYGFFKNLKFFEPFLLIILLAWGVSLFEIGILIAIQEAISLFFEIPSGMIADNRGKKTELMICFIFYLVSFVFYFYGPNFIILIFASIFFGLGEAFRSGTHKAMEMHWLDKTDLSEYKSFVYGTTRSYSLYGASISSILAIIFILNVPASRWIFLITMIPYIIDFFLISSYPKYMNERASDTEKLSYWREMINSFSGLKILFKEKKLRKGLISSSVFNGIYKSIKDYIQPILELFIIIILMDFALSSDANSQEFFLAVFLGLLYSLFYLISSFSSQKAHAFENKFSSSKKAFDFVFYFLGFVILLEAIFISVELPIMVVILYLMIYVSYNLRRPIVVGFLGDNIEKDQRATILSVDSQLRSIFVIFLAPLFGFIADTYSISVLFYVIAIMIFFINIIIIRGE